MSKQQKQIAIVAGAALALILLYKWYTGQQAGAASTGAVAPDTAAGDYAALAGQEQSDIAALQGQNSQLLAQEQSDVAGLQGDIAGLTGQISGYSDQINWMTAGESSLAASLSGLGQTVAKLASGQQQLSRAQNQTITPHKGGGFYNYYVKVTGHKPPATVKANDWVYQAWKSGVKAAALQAPVRHPSSKNAHIQHPNGNHTQQKHVKPATKSVVAAKPGQKPAKPSPTRIRTAPKPPPKPTKPRKSGVRK